MMLDPYSLEGLVRERHADFLAESTHQAIVAEALRAQRADTSKRVPRQARVVSTPTWSSHEPRVALRTN